MQGLESKKMREGCFQSFEIPKSIQTIQLKIFCPVFSEFDGTIQNPENPRKIFVYFFSKEFCNVHFVLTDRFKVQISSIKFVSGLSFRILFSQKKKEEEEKNISFACYQILTNETFIILL